jgi:cell division protein FtsZ
MDVRRDALKFEVQEEGLRGTRIKVVGVGGGGSNAVARMMSEGVTGVEFHVLNTDLQALDASPVPNKLAIGRKVTNGLGAGSDPSIGRLAALEDTERVIEILEGSDMVFVTAGMGGGTGTGAAPVVASLAKELNALTVAVVTKPFTFEGPRRHKAAERGLADLASTVDTVISIPNEKLLELLPKGTSFFQAFRTADDVLRQAVQGIADIITTPGIINRDFSDIRAIMLGAGYAMMGTATARGEDAAVQAARAAISSGLLEDGGVKGARGVLINITASSQLSIQDVNEACQLIRTATEYDDVQINFGIVLNENMGDEVKITVIATGFQRAGLPSIERERTPVVTESKMISGPPPQAPFPQSTPPEISIRPQRANPFADRGRFEDRSAPAARSEAEPEIVTEPSDPEAINATATVIDSDKPQEPGQEDEQRSDLDIPAFMRRERRLFQ